MSSRRADCKRWSVRGALVCVLLLVTANAVAGSIDRSRAEQIRRQLQPAVDASVLIAMKKLELPDRQRRQIALLILNTQLRQAGWEQDVQRFMKIDGSNASISVEIMVPKFFGTEQMPVIVTAEKRLA